MPCLNPLNRFPRQTASNEDNINRDCRGGAAGEDCSPSAASSRFQTGLSGTGAIRCRFFRVRADDFEGECPPYWGIRGARTIVHPGTHSRGVAALSALVEVRR